PQRISRTPRLTMGLLCLTPAACAPKADVIITGGMVWTGLSTGLPPKGAVALAGGKILAVGDDAALARYAGPKTQWIQANGGLVLPGFTDGHTHFIDGGFQLASVSLRDAATPREFFRRIKEYARRLKAGERILGGDSARPEDRRAAGELQGPRPRCHRHRDSRPLP